MKTNLKSKKSLGALIILVGLIFVPLSFVKADSGASLYLTPSSGNYNTDNLINVSVEINTGDETINAVKSILNFNEKLEVQSISKSGSILGLWMEEPSFDNSARTVSFGGAGAGTTYKGSAGKLITITFKAKDSGTGIINFSSNSVKYGATTIEVDSAIGSSFVINVSCSCTSWQNNNCGGGDCSSTYRFQTRTCTPFGCSLEERCIEDSSCLAAPITKEKVVEEPITESEIVEATVKEEMLQRSLLANLTVAWGGTGQLTLLVIIASLCLMALVFIGLKEWKLFQRKKKK